MRKLTLLAAAITLTAALAEGQYKTPTAPTRPTQNSVPPNVESLQVPAPATADDELVTARRITRDQAMRLVKQGKAVYVDVRSKESYDEGHLPGAVSLPLSQLQARFKDLPLKKFLITYCA